MTNNEKKSFPAYIRRLSSDLVDNLYANILREVVVKERFLEPDMTATKLAQELKTDSRYISAVMMLRFNDSFNGMLNRHRVEKAIYMMRSGKYDESTCEMIGLRVGFNSRQSFYSAFNKIMGMTPMQFRDSMKNK